MAAEDSGGGGGIGRRFGPLPAWGWALVIGGLVGVVYFVRQGSKPAAAADTTQSYGDSNDERTTVLPVNSGLANEQFLQLLDAIKSLHGDSSTPLPAGGQAPRSGLGPPAAGVGPPWASASGTTAIRQGPASASGTTAIRQA